MAILNKLKFLKIVEERVKDMDLLNLIIGNLLFQQ